MADGYLEQKMEEHRAGRGSSSATPKQKLTPRGTTPGEWLLKFTPCQVLIEDIEESQSLTIARRLIAIGFKVCFRHPDLHRGQKLASTIGAQLLPPGLQADPNAISLNLLSTDRVILKRGKSAIHITLDSDFALDTALLAAIHLANNYDLSSVLQKTC